MVFRFRPENFTSSMLCFLFIFFLTLLLNELVFASKITSLSSFSSPSSSMMPSLLRRMLFALCSLADNSLSLYNRNLYFRWQFLKHTEHCCELENNDSTLALHTFVSMVKMLYILLSFFSISFTRKLGEIYNIFNNKVVL